MPLNNKSTWLRWRTTFNSGTATAISQVCVTTRVPRAELRTLETISKLRLTSSSLPRFPSSPSHHLLHFLILVSPFPLFFFYPFLPFPALSLFVLLRNPARSLWEHCNFSQRGLGGVPGKTNFTDHSCKIWHFVTSILVTFVRSYNNLSLFQYQSIFQSIPVGLALQQDTCTMKCVNCLDAVPLYLLVLLL